MMRYLPVFAGAVAALIALPLPAQSGDCRFAADQGTMKRCVDQQLKAADAQLNQVSRARSQGGSIHAMVVSPCLATLTRQQVAGLERHLSCVRN